MIPVHVGLEPVPARVLPPALRTEVHPLAAVLVPEVPPHVGHLPDEFAAQTAEESVGTGDNVVLEQGAQGGLVTGWKDKEEVAGKTFLIKALSRILCFHNFFFLAVAIVEYLVLDTCSNDTLVDVHALDLVRDAEMVGHGVARPVDPLADRAPVPQVGIDVPVPHVGLHAALALHDGATFHADQALVGSQGKLVHHPINLGVHIICKGKWGLLIITVGRKCLLDHLAAA